MIAKGNPHNNGPYLARYLASDSKGNERSELGELRGFAVDNIFDAFALGQLMADGTRCENPFFHVQVRLPKSEALTREQWHKTADRIERHLGFDDQPRAIVFHKKEGQEHMHLVWSRIDTEDMRAIDPGLYKNKLKEVSRVLENEMGLKQVKNKRDPDELTQPAARPEYEQSRRLKTDLKEIRETIRECWDKNDTGQSFAAALEGKGFFLAQGDRRDFVVIDERCGIHALSKRITGATAKETRERMADVDRESLPSIDQARAWQREKEVKVMPDQQGIDKEEQKKEAIGREEEQKHEAIQKEEDQKQQAIQDEEQRKEASFRDEETRRNQFKEQAERQASQAKEMELQQQRLDDYRENLTRQVEEAQRVEAQRTQAEREAATKELAIRDSGSRYGQALAQHYDIRDPYGSLARSAMAEYGAFLRDRENINRQIARATDPTERKALELQKRIEGAEYMAITSTRIAAQSEIIVGRLNSEEAVHQRARAGEFQKEAQELRKEFRELQATRIAEKKEPTSSKTADKDPSPALIVEERVTGKKEWETQKLADYVKTVESKQPQHVVTAEEMKRDPTARSAYYEGIAFNQRRDSALEHIREDMKAGRNLNAADVRNLTRDDLENIRNKGDEHLKQIVQEHSRQRERERER